MGNEALKQLATQDLSELYRTITTFEKLQEEYGVLEEIGMGDEKEGRLRRLRSELSLGLIG
jgi:hypothetical protein